MSSFLRSSSSRSSSVIILDFDCMHPISSPFSQLLMTECLVACLAIVMCFYVVRVNRMLHFTSHHISVPTKPNEQCCKRGAVVHHDVAQAIFRWAQMSSSFESEKRKDDDIHRRTYWTLEFRSTLCAYTCNLLLEFWRKRQKKWNRQWGNKDDEDFSAIKENAQHHYDILMSLTLETHRYWNTDRSSGTWNSSEHVISS